MATIIGPGILTLPAIAASIAGPASLIVLATLLLVSVPIAFTFVSLERITPGSGGVAYYAARAFGPGAGRMVGYWFYLGVPIGVPALGMIAGSYVSSAMGAGKPVVIGVAAVIVAGALSLAPDAHLVALQASGL